MKKYLKKYSRDIIIVIGSILLFWFLLQKILFIGVVEGPSMMPTLYNGDLIIGLRNTEIQKGDIIVFWRDGKLIVHRVIEMKNCLIITKGDNPRTNPAPDPPIRREQICAKILFWVPKGRILLDGLKILVMVLICYEIWIELQNFQKRKLKKKLTKNFSNNIMKLEVV